MPVQQYDSTTGARRPTPQQPPISCALPSPYGGDVYRKARLPISIYLSQNVSPRPHGSIVYSFIVFLSYDMRTFPTKHILQAVTCNNILRRNQVDPCSRGQELAGGVLRCPPKPGKKNIFCHSRRMHLDFFFSYILCTPAANYFFMIRHAHFPDEAHTTSNTANHGFV